MLMTRKQPPKPPFLLLLRRLLLLLMPTSIPRLRRPTSKRPTPRILMRILLPLIHLLLKLLRLLLIRKTQPRQTIFQLKRMEECPVLVILEGVVDLLIPEDTSVRRADVYELDPEGVAYEVVGEDSGAL